MIISIFLSQFFFAKTNASASVILQSWREALYPLEIQPLAYLGNISSSMRESAVSSLSFITGEPRNFIWLFWLVLSMTPSLYLFVFSRPEVKELLLLRVNKIAMLCCAIFPFALFAIATDYGLWIQQISFYWFFLFVYFSTEKRRKAEENAAACSSYATFFIILCLVISATVRMPFYLASTDPIILPSTYFYNIFLRKMGAFM